MHADGTYVGRSAPEIDIFEAQVSLFPTPDANAISVTHISAARLRENRSPGKCRNPRNGL